MFKVISFCSTTTHAHFAKTFTLCHKTLQNDVQRWPYCDKNCKCFIKLSPSNIIVESNTKHEPDKKALNRQIMSNSLKRKALVDISCKPSKLIRSELKQGDIPTLTYNDLSLIRHNIHRAFLSVHPLCLAILKNYMLLWGPWKLIPTLVNSFCL